MVARPPRRRSCRSDETHVRVYLTIPLVAVAIALLAVFCGPAPAGAQEEKSLHWNALEVEARLDASGRLHVTERQKMVFTGHWNGGERRFRIGAGQEIDLERVTRIDADGTTRTLGQGDLDAVDHYDWHTRNTLRWRSRLPSDPPFERTAITYVLEYSLANILIPEGNGNYTLDHDFAFPDRDGPIERFALALDLDPAWQGGPTYARTWEGHDLEAGKGYVIRLPLRFLGPGRPAQVMHGAPPALRRGLALFLVAGIGIGLALLIRRERALGRFAPLPAASSIDEAWLAENLFSMAPEVAGAVFDEVTSAPEVAAVLARLVNEGKLASEIKKQRAFIFTKDVLHLELLVDRDQLEGYERTLVNALFVNGNTTDTELIRRHYRSRGFDPAEKIRSPLAKKVQAILGRRTRTAADLSWRPIVLTLIAGALVMLFAAIRRPQEMGQVFTLLVAAVPLTIFGAIQAFMWRRKATRLSVHALRFVIPVVLVAAITISLLLLGSRTSTAMLVGLALSGIGLASAVIHTAKCRSGAEGVRARQQLAAARRHFAEELKRENPKLNDSWFPYLIALGLGPEMDRWFRAFKREGLSVTGHGAFGGSTSTSGGGSSSSGGSWTGGGGSFGGAGATSSWAAAAGTLAAGVPSASSSGSGGGGGGGGGGSSGGGGGGGW